MSFASTSTTSIFNTDTRVRDCGIHKNHFLAPLIAILAFFVTIGFDTMWLMQDKSPVMGQWMRPNLCAKQQVQQSVNNRHVIHDTASQGYALHRISPTITTTKKVLTLFIPSLYGNTNEPYGRVVPPAYDESSKVNQDDSRLDSTNAPQVAASSAGAGGDDDEEDSDKKKLNNDGCGGDESPTDGNDDEEEDDEDDDPENAFRDEAVEVGVVDETEEEDMVGL